MRLLTYLKNFVLFNIFIAAAPLVIQFIAHRPDLLIPYFWDLFSAFSVLHLVIYIVSSWGLLKGNKTSVRLSLGGTSLKFLIWMIFTFFYLREVPVEPVKFLFNFFYLYLFHTAFEIYSLFSNLRDPKIK